MWSLWGHLPRWATDALKGTENDVPGTRVTLVQGSFLVLFSLGLWLRHQGHLIHTPENTWPQPAQPPGCAVFLTLSLIVSLPLLEGPHPWPRPSAMAPPASDGPAHQRWPSREVPGAFPVQLPN